MIDPGCMECGEPLPVAYVGEVCPACRVAALERPPPRVEAPSEPFGDRVERDRDRMRRELKREGL